MTGLIPGSTPSEPSLVWPPRLAFSTVAERPTFGNSRPGALEVHQAQSHAQHRALAVVVDQRVAIAVEELRVKAQVALDRIANRLEPLEPDRALAVAAQ